MFCDAKGVMIYSPGTPVTLSTAPARIPGPPGPDLIPIPKYGARTHPWPPTQNPKGLMIYSPGTPVTLSTAPARIPGPPRKTLKVS